MAKAQQGERRRRAAPVADETTPQVVGLVESSYLVAPTGRGNGRWDGGELEMPQDTRHDRFLGDDGNDAERAPSAKGTRGHIQPKDTAQQPGPRPVGGAPGRLLPVQPLLARGGDNAPAQVAMRCEAPPIAHQVDVGQGHERRQFFQEFQRREANARSAVGPRVSEGVEEVAIGIRCKSLKRYCTSCGVANEALHLIPPMRWDRRVRMHGKAVHTRTPRTGELWRLTLVAKA